MIRERLLRVLERLGRLFAGKRRGARPTPTDHLPDGTPVIVRAIQPTDAEAMVDALSRLSARSRYQRFLGAVDELSPEALDYLTHADGVNHLALGMAVLPPDGEPRPVAIARCIREASDPEQAEVAFVVADEWQRRGVGSLLVHRLSEQARAAGILRWKAEMLAENEGALRLLAKVGPLRCRRMQARGVVEVIHDLSPAEQLAAGSRR